MIEIQQPSMFDYGTLDNDTRVFVQEKAQSIHTRLKRTAEDIVAIGLDLASVKNRLGYGQFDSWVQAEFDMSRRTAYRFMQVAAKFGSRANLAQVTPSALYLLAESPDEIIEMVESGQIAPTVSAIREAKRELAQPVSPEPQSPLRFDEEDDENVETELQYDGSKPAYCINCYKTHYDWTLQEEQMWECHHCQYRIADDCMQLAEGSDVNVEEDDEENIWIENDIPTIEPEARAMPPIMPVVDPVREITEESFEQYKARMEKRQQKEQEREQRRDVNRQLIAESKSIDEALGTAKFSTIVIDPPWDWGDEGDVDQFGRATPLYGTMSLEQLLEMPVGNYADTDCHIYLWITNRSLPKGFQLLECWGFRYVTCVTWVKPYFGMGNYFRGQTEHLLFGVKGSQALKRHNAGTYFAAPRGPKGHSSKPLEAYDLIESCSPGPYLELFARSDRPDWTSWGAEV